MAASLEKEIAALDPQVDENLLENYEYDDSWLDEETKETDESFKRWEEDQKNDKE